jgi:hypothetical protein
MSVYNPQQAIPDDVLKILHADGFYAPEDQIKPNLEQNTVDSVQIRYGLDIKKGGVILQETTYRNISRKDGHTEHLKSEIQEFNSSGQPNGYYVSINLLQSDDITGSYFENTISIQNPSTQNRAALSLIALHTQNKLDTIEHAYKIKQKQEIENEIVKKKQNNPIATKSNYKKNKKIRSKTALSIK